MGFVGKVSYTTPCCATIWIEKQSTFCYSKIQKYEYSHISQEKSREVKEFHARELYEELKGLVDRGAASNPDREDAIFLSLAKLLPDPEVDSDLILQRFVYSLCPQFTPKDKILQQFIPSILFSTALTFPRTQNPHQKTECFFLSILQFGVALEVGM